MLEEIIIKPRQGLRIDLKEIWQYRELLYSLVLRDIKIRYKHTAIGVGWVLLQPLAMMLLFTLFFGRFIKTSTNEMPYAVFALSGAVVWAYFSNAINNAANSLQQYKYIISKVYFPRLILPIVGVSVGAIDFAISLALLMVILLFYGVTLKLTLLALPLVSIAVIFVSFSVGVWLSALNAIYYDIRYILPFLIQLWLFASPVVYPVSVVPEKWQMYYYLNPLVGLLEGFRWCLSGVGAIPNSFWVSIGIAILLSIGGVTYFRRVESTLADLL
ncbi:MAG: ABC transporter permease [Bacteroidia bacterium]